mmetsp:Transcript_59846/g.177360  ORF Transcript_59846/g.177360 Transcript_59846/m.177360 type:complete len:788 (-) Transcript_59846:40-2403(-)
MDSPPSSLGGGAPQSQHKKRLSSSSGSGGGGARGRRRRPAPPPRLEWGGVGIGKGSGSLSAWAIGGRVRGVVSTPDANASPTEEASPSPSSLAESAGSGDRSSVDRRRNAGGSGQTFSQRMRAAAPGGGGGKAGFGASATSRKRKSASSSAAVTAASGASSSSGRRTDIAKTASCSSSKMMWVDKYAPLDDTSALCVAPKKVKEVREWLCRSWDSWSGGGAEDISNDAGKLLILVGSPGVGKSATARILAAEMGWHVREWNDSHMNANAGGAFGGLRGGGYDSALSLPYQSQISSFGDFLQSAGSGFESLSGVGAMSGRWDDHELDPKADSTGKGRKGGRNRSRDDKSSPSHGRGALILIEEIPNLHTAEAAEKFRSVMCDHIHSSRVPTVLIFSDVTEGKHRPGDLERLIDPSLLYSPLVQIKQIQPATKAKMKKCLEGIAKAEGLGRIPPDFLEEVHCSSGGDIRHAIMALQFRYGAGKRVARAGSNKEGRRDKRLSTFHALGKLLYAKRKKTHGNSAGGACTNAASSSESMPPLDFVPEDVMNESDMEQGGALSFLLYHSPDFFTDEIELSQAFDSFSDAAMLLGRNADRDRSDSVFPEQYVSSLAGRAVADANRHPAPNKFRQFGAPKVFEVLRKRRANGAKMLQLCKRLSCGSGTLPLGINVGSASGFVVDCLPFMRTILPDEVNYSLSNLHSYARQAEENGSVQSSSSIFQREVEEQRELLKEDDIVDDNSFGSDNEKENDDTGGDQRDRHSSEFAAAPSKPKRRDSEPDSRPSPEVIILD